MTEHLKGLDSKAQRLIGQGPGKVRHSCFNTKRWYPNFPNFLPLFFLRFF